MPSRIESEVNPNVPGTVYLVGGSLRDEMLGIEAEDSDPKKTDRDWVVTGATPQAMVRAGLKPVGKAFPVYLDPQTGDQYALARTERKVGRGHQAFEFEFDTGIDLEEDLRRRDLTINAMARDIEGNLIDPYGGREDLQQKVLRHVSDAFREDPLRVFRVARFAASMPEFSVAPETVELMSTMGEELGDLSAERVWHEYAKAMGGLTPFRFFDTLNEVDAVDPWFSGLAVIGLSTMLRERWLRKLHAVAAVGWIHDESTAVEWLRRVKAPGRVLRLARDVARYGHALSGFFERDDESALVLLEHTNAFRPGEAFMRLVTAVEKCSGVDLKGVAELAENLRAIRLRNVSNEEYGWRLREARLEGVAEYLREHRTSA